MFMDTFISAASVKDMNYLEFTKVSTWCPNVNAPSRFRKPLYKEFLVQMNMKMNVELLSP